MMLLTRVSAFGQRYPKTHKYHVQCQATQRALGKLDVKINQTILYNDRSRRRGNEGKLLLTLAQNLTGFRLLGRLPLHAEGRGGHARTVVRIEQRPVTTSSSNGMGNPTAVHPGLTRIAGAKVWRQKHVGRLHEEARLKKAHETACSAKWQQEQRHLKTRCRLETASAS
jgi:hypothetical protein